jgi:hypothetical protein
MKIVKKTHSVTDIATFSMVIVEMGVKTGFMATSATILVAIIASGEFAREMENV